MRAASLLPFAFTAALAAACGSEKPSRAEPEETAGRPAAAPVRDLTLQVPQPAAAEVISAVELGRPEPAAARPSRAVRPRPRPKPAPAVRPEADPTPAAEPVVMPASPVIEAVVHVPEAEAAGGGRELAPGKTVTVIPVSNGPVVEADDDDSWLPSERPRSIIRGGGTCQPRGGVRGIGIAGRIPVGIPARRLR